MTGTNTHRAIIYTSVPPGATVIAAGSEDWCSRCLHEYIAQHPLNEYETGEVLAIVEVIR